MYATLDIWEAERGKEEENALNIHFFVLISSLHKILVRRIEKREGIRQKREISREEKKKTNYTLQYERKKKRKNKF